MTDINEGNGKSKQFWMGVGRRLAAGVVFTDDPKRMIGWFTDGVQGRGSCGEIQFQLTESQEQLQRHSGRCQLR